MAEEKNESKSSAGQSKTNTFQKGMVKDINETFVGEGLYTHARNAINNTHHGQIGVIGNEPSNLHCFTFPYTVIGAISLTDDKWAIFTTDDINSEIGIFDDSECTYTRVVNDSCLNFKKSNLVTGAYKERYDCERVVYWDDGLNPTRFLNLDNVPWKENCQLQNNCNICTPIVGDLDCDKIRLTSYVVSPCIQVEKGKIAGTLPNGSYQVCLAYTINQVKITDYIGLSEVQSVFNHQGDSSSIEIKILKVDEENFEEFELVVLATINLKTYAKHIGYYSTSQGTIYLDRWDPEFPSVDSKLIPIRTEPVERTDATFQLNNYLIRTGPRSKFKFNYQPQANNIIAKWVAVEYPQDYHRKGGNNTGYMRDEQYAFFIRFIYNTGERSESYHIPGRPPFAGDRTIVTGPDIYETTPVEKWEAYNTATVIPTGPIAKLPDGGQPIAEGYMGFWESETEFYPDNRPDIWGTLCGEKIRHHKMPDETVSSSLSIFKPGGSKIVLLGVKFENITPPLDQNNQPIQSVVGYEILRGSREGNKTILAKGIINNMLEYPIPGNPIKGLFQNYPFNDVNPDPYLTTNFQNSEKSGAVNVTSPKLSTIKNDIFSFHGPDVSFNNPFLSTNQLKLYSEYRGLSQGYFAFPFRHPRFKVVSDFTNVISTLITLIDAASGIAQIVSSLGTGGGQKTGGINFEGTEGLPVSFNFGNIEKPPKPPISSGGDSLPGSAAILFGAAQLVNLGLWAIEVAAWVAQTVALLALNYSMATAKKQKLLDVFFYLIPQRQYARQHIAHGFYDNYGTLKPNETRRYIELANYVFPQVQQFTTSYQINNINRSQYVCLKLNTSLQNTTQNDESKYISSEVGCPEELETINKPIASYYGALKIPIPNQYGQLWSIKQLPISSNCLTTISSNSVSITSPILFGGDVYITRFTEKNTMFFFDNWLIGDPDDTLVDYLKYTNIPFPRFWINTESVKNITLLQFPSNYRALDCNNDSPGIGFSSAGNLFYVKRGMFYLFNSGVRDFFVESEINVDYRDWEDEFGKRHYDPYEYTDLQTMFRSDLIKNGNFYKYDYSLSISKLPGSSVSWGNLLPRYYDPQDAATCFTYTPNRIIYSSPSDLDAPSVERKVQDSWRIFLPNNTKDFETPVKSIRSINKTGALFLMQNQGPFAFAGIEQMSLDQTNTIITIGTGSLFKNTLQNVVRADQSFQYGSCQSRYSVISTLHGVFWVSQEQGKIFLYSNGIDEITRSSGLKMWFSRNLPSNLLAAFPAYIHKDNPVRGVGVLTVYDNTYELFYVTKKDYRLKDRLSGTYRYDVDEDQFYFNNVPISLTDTTHFEDASWTASYDPKSKQWISFHDWKPTFVLPSKRHFLTVNDISIWRHNVRCDSYCNFYSNNYPFEIEFISSTGQTVNSFRNIEYLLEVYRYHNNCYDKYHELDENFDQAIVYNSEQISGLLNLFLKSKTNPLDVIKQPVINPSSIDILFSKEENKYRFNQFWDITKDRGEFNNINIPMFITDANGVSYNVNPAYVNYNKPALQRKKFRHNVNRVFLRKTVSGPNNMLFKLSNQKLLNSPR